MNEWNSCGATEKKIQTKRKRNLVFSSKQGKNILELCKNVSKHLKKYSIKYIKNLKQENIEKYPRNKQLPEVGVEMWIHRKYET